MRCRRKKIRDDFEFALLDVAETNAIPVLGICRGIQLINVRAGGGLHQDVPQHAAFDDPPVTVQHEITFVKGSRLHGLYGESHTVNSLHHQTLNNVGDRYRVTGRSHDGHIEAIEHVELSIVAVQWHPEMLLEATQDPLFRWLIDASLSLEPPDKHPQILATGRLGCHAVGSPPHGVEMSDGDTRKVNEEVLKDPSAQWRPLEKFRSFERIDQIWVFIGLGLLILTLNIVFGFGGNSSSGG